MKMKISILFLFVCFHVGLRASDTVSTNRRELIKIADEELQEFIRLSNQKHHKDPKILLRMAELTLEKARLIKEGENETFLNINPEKRAKLNKKNYFRESKSY